MLYVVSSKHDVEFNLGELNLAIHDNILIILKKETGGGKRRGLNPSRRDVAPSRECKSVDLEISLSPREKNIFVFKSNKTNHDKL